MAPKGNMKMANKIIMINIIPKMLPILFVGMSFFGNALPMISLRVSLPAYLYSGFFI